MYIKRSNEQVLFNHEFLVPATSELVQLNKRWQWQIMEEKERKRNAGNNEQDGNSWLDGDLLNRDQVVKATEASTLFLNDNDDVSSDSIYTHCVKEMSLSSGPTRQHTAQQFTLNKNQIAAFMIITGHLDGVNRMNKDGRRSICKWAKHFRSLFLFSSRWSTGTIDNVCTGMWWHW